MCFSRPSEAVDANDDCLATKAFEAAEYEIAAEMNASSHETFLAPNIAALNADNFMTTPEPDDERREQNKISGNKI